MNFAISRAELIALTGVRRTKTFELQKTGQLRATSSFATKTWFSIDEALHCVALLQGVDPPDRECVEAQAMAVLQARLCKQANHK